MYVRMVSASIRWFPTTVMLEATAAAAESAERSETAAPQAGSAKTRASANPSLRAKIINEFIGFRYPVI
jgi:hypothetical protein